MPQIGETELDVRALSRALWRRAWLLILLAVLAAAATYAGLGLIDPLYTADTRILIEERESPLTRQRDQPGDVGVGFDESAIQSQVEVLRSREIASAVINTLNLTNRPEFDPSKQPSLLRALLVTVGLRAAPTEAGSMQLVMESYFERLSVYPVQKSRVLGVEFSAPDPELAAEVANAIAAAFVALQQNAKRESAVAATDWLQQEIERLRLRVGEAEQAVAKYRAENGLFDVDQRGPDVGNLSTQQLGDLNAELARARAARAEAEARAQLVQSLLSDGGELEAAEEVLSSPLIQRLRERQVALRAQIAELSTTLLPGHPRIRALGGQVANLQGQIRQEAEKVLASLQTAARVAAARETSLEASLNTAKGDVTRSNEREIDLRALEREAAAQRALLESFLTRYREAAARTDADYLPADARIISLAVAPREPSFPKKTMMAVAAAIAIFLIASAIVLMREFVSGSAFRVIGFAGPVAPTSPAEHSPIAAAPLARARLEAERDEARSKPDAPDVVAADVVGAAVAGPRVAAPEVPAVRVAAPEVVAPEVVAPEVVAPEVVAPEVVAPEVVAPEVVAPEVVAKAHHAIGPEAREAPEAHETVEPYGPDVVAPDMPEVAAPESRQGAEPEAREAMEEESGTAIEHRLVAAAQQLGESVRSGDRRSAAAQLEPIILDSDGDFETDEAGDPLGTADLAEIIAGPAVRIALFAGAEGGEGAGDLAFSAARLAAQERVRCVLIDVGPVPSHALGHERPGLGELLAGEAAFGEVIQRDDTARVHVISMGGLARDASLKRMQLVIGALTHTYDKVIVVANSIADWPNEHVRPDIAAIVCGPDSTEARRTALYDDALARGAESAIIVRYSGDSDTNGRGASEAA